MPDPTLSNPPQLAVPSPAPQTVRLAVNGTLMRGLELNQNLLDVNATFVQETMTKPCYRLWSIGDRHPAMLRVTERGRAIAVEVWAVPTAGLVQILLQEPPGLCIGKVELWNGETVLGVLGEPALCEGQLEITEWGGWRAYLSYRS
ncbi:MAG: glutamyl-tRNA amidotransferase [Elainella sp.]